MEPSSTQSATLSTKNENEARDDGSKNGNKIACTICGSVIMLSNVGIWVNGNEFALPKATQEKGALNTAVDPLEGWWTVSDMFAFENVGFTHAVNDVKYLTCADCEYGPIGLLDNATGLYYIAPSRVKTV